MRLFSITAAVAVIGLTTATASAQHYHSQPYRGYGGGYYVPAPVRVYAPPVFVQPSFGFSYNSPGFSVGFGNGFYAPPVYRYSNYGYPGYGSNRGYSNHGHYYYR